MRFADSDVLNVQCFSPLLVGLSRESATGSGAKSRPEHTEQAMASVSAGHLATGGDMPPESGIYAKVECLHCPDALPGRLSGVSLRPIAVMALP